MSSRTVILLRSCPDGKKELSLLDPATGRESRTGLRAGPAQEDIDRNVRKMKETLERAGNHVEVKEVAS